MNGPVGLVVFDCDGVLVDTERYGVPLETRVANRLGWPLTEAELVEKFMGTSVAEAGRIIDERLGPGSAERWFEEYHELFHAGLDRLTPVPGVVEALAAIDLPTCVASSGTHEMMRTTLGRTGLWEHFEGRIYSASEVAHGKPAPDLFLHAARSMGFAPGECVVVEDSAYGVRAARAAGMRCLAYAGGLAPAASLDGPGTVLFEDMRELPRLIARIASAS
ncbi:HAD family hydrolase [Streptomyces sp. NPDC051940]|uniref:HAD family hydrolase n=1 Tax=Streptomyces sp. NPDC051940 TaxID=3155675 RepID=UPI00343C90A2